MLISKKNIVLKILFFIPNNVQINFLELNIFSRVCAFIKAIVRTKQIKLINKKEFIVKTLVLEEKTYIIDMVSLAN